ncbi:MAG: dihydrodipicolinate synthase family protein [Spirochaetales bacterium]|uniref:Dihydrodipicolinate synthase family protein n=1 Tax=Candidatus Thalassospirochaeta sargassi TaxID=3119039 RepID=A0AAJ1IK92_9SPIO|nr:dihydrodipicolinate synthase family protein [Spirochaetales bacterium]
MNKNKEMLSGVFAPMCTPFENDEVNISGFEQNIKTMNSSSLKGFFVLGTNGEFKTVSETERVKILETAVGAAASDKVVMAGTGVESTRETIRLTKQAAEIGVSSVSLLMPNFFAKKIDDEVMINHILEVADASPIPVVLYNNPSVAAGITISEAVVEAVSVHENVVGVKDSSKDTWSANTAYDSDGFSVMAGSASYFLDLLEKGGTGGVLSLANIIPDACGELYNLYIAGKKEEAYALNERLVSLNKLVSGKYGVAGVKYAMDYAGFAGGAPRRPLKALTGEQKKSVESDLAASGFFN